jgi:hypothetical protein
MAAMAELTAQQVMLCVAAFEAAWVRLLSENRVRDENIEKLPTLIVAAVLEDFANGELEQNALAAGALARVKDFKEEIKH